MVKTDAQERIDNVFRRATQKLSEEFIDINVSGPFPERGVLYKVVEEDFRSYSTLGNDLIEEVNANLSSGLRPAEVIKYITNLNSYTYGLQDGYEYVESDEFVNKIFIPFGRPVFETDTKKPHLTEEDKKYIREVVEEVRQCCYEFSKAAKVITEKIHPFLTAYGIMPQRWSPSVPLPQQKPKPNPVSETVVSPKNQLSQIEEPEKNVFKTLPPKILLLDKLGFFELPEVQKLSLESKGKLVSALCGGSADNAVDYIRHCDPNRRALEKNPYRNHNNIKVVQDLLNSLN